MLAVAVAVAVAVDVNDVPVIKDMLHALVSGYQPSPDVVDWVHLEQYADADEYV